MTGKVSNGNDQSLLDFAKVFFNEVNRVADSKGSSALKLEAKSGDVVTVIIQYGDTFANVMPKEEVH